jgi:hypothetical protein
MKDWMSEFGMNVAGSGGFCATPATVSNKKTTSAILSIGWISGEQFISGRSPTPAYASLPHEKPRVVV